MINMDDKLIYDKSLEMRQLVERLAKVSNRLEYLKSWETKKDITFDYTEKADLELRQAKIKAQIKQMGAIK